MASFRRRKGKWEAQVRLAGHRPISRSFTLKEDAQKWARDREGQIQRQGLPENQARLRSITLKQLMERYRDTISAHKSWGRNEAFVLNALMRQDFAQVSIVSLDCGTFAQFRDQRVHQVKPGTVNHEMKLLSQIFRVAKSEWGYPIVNPLDGLKRPAPDNARSRRLQDGELPEVLAAAMRCRNESVGAAIRFAIETAMRRGELLGINWIDWDQKKQTLHIPVTKTRTPRTIPLSQNAVQILLNQQGRGLPSPFPLTVEAFRMAWKRLIKRSGITDLHFHDLRHEAITRFFEMGLSVPEVAVISGHKDYRMLARYTHLRAEDIANKLWAGSDPPPTAPVTSHQPVARTDNVIAINRKGR